MVTVKVLGTGCPNCKKVEEVARRAIAGMGIEAQVEKVTDMGRITEYPILRTPGLVINEQVVCSGRIPTDAEVMAWLADARETSGHG